MGERAVTERLLAWADWLDGHIQRRLPQGPAPWWLWPSFLVLVASACLAAAAVVTPGEGESLFLLGQRFGDECGFLQATGLPCASCGMTRSWVWLVRGEVWLSWRYSPGGAALLGWVAFAGALGLVRLVLRKPGLLKADYRLLTGWVLVWMVFLNVGAWVLRLWGVNPLP